MTRAGKRPVAESVITGPEAFAARFDVSRETLAKLARYESLLRRWQKAVNLVAPASLDEVWRRHFADSAQLLALAPAAGTWLDLGSGAGFPGLVIAILLSSGENGCVHVVESNARKCAFMAEVVRETGCSVEIHQARIERLAAGGKFDSPDIVTARALAPLERLLDLAAPFFATHTKGLFPKGAGVKAEMAKAANTWDFTARLHPSLTEPEGRIIEVSGPLSRITRMDDAESCDGTR